MFYYLFYYTSWLDFPFYEIPKWRKCWIELKITFWVGGFVGGFVTFVRE